MTEQEWLACTEPRPMLVSVAPRASRRKLLLFACGTCRRVWHLLSDPRSRGALVLVERYADGLVRDDELAASQQDAHQALEEIDRARRGRRRKRSEQAADGGKTSAAAAAECVTREATYPLEELKATYGLNESNSGAPGYVVDAAYGAAQANPQARYRGASFHPAVAAEWLVQCDLLRDLFGNPFRRIRLDPSWRTADVLALAQAAYEHRALPAGTLEPVRLGLLADALEDAGCASADLLGHLRSEGPHVRGCWAVDALLGKS